MISDKQEKWLNHLSDTDVVRVVPYDPATPKKFLAIKEKIEGVLADVEIVHRGASSLGISGQGELDVYIPVSKTAFNTHLDPLVSLFGDPGTVYPDERARFVTQEDGTKVEVFLINKESEGWLNGLKFEKYLKQNPECLEDYQRIKEEVDGFSTRQYYRRKIEFINDILAKTEG